MSTAETDATIPDKGKRLALVIGVDHAPHSLLPSLRHAATDAEAVADVLVKHCQFELLEPPLLNENANSDSVKKSVRRLARHRTDEDFLLPYFSGHGQPMTIEADRRDVYLVTHDFAAIDVEEDEDAHFSMRWLRDKLYLPTQAGKVLLILDCCYAGDIGRTAPDPYLEELKQRINFYFGAPGTESGVKSGGLRLALTATGHDAIAKEKDGSGVMTGILLPALRGDTKEVLDANGAVSLQLLHYHLQCAMPSDQQPSLSGDFAGRSCILANHPDQVEQLNPRLEQNIKHADRGERLHAMLADHRGFMRDRLESFVGRQTELAEIKQRIVEKKTTGGYVTITGQAGQGKSSIIAKLVQIYGPENVAFHFIPFNPGPDHQVGLLRNLMVRLILKYDLSDLYVAGESRPALRDYFPKVLRELVEKGGQEVIFVDGLDQIEEHSGVRDLSFLPTNPPPGVVFVLGTRPNDTLRPLELLKPHHEYKLPNLSRSDFDLILSHRRVRLKRELTDRFYKAMQENALYLDLVAKELAETDVTNLTDVIKRVSDNPDNIFSLSVDRFKRQERQWRIILKPILGLLLASREPLKVKHIRQILNIDNDEVRDGLRRLGGLVSEDGQGRRYLFHIKLQDFLRQDENKPHKEYIFATDEEMLWHKKIVGWCGTSDGGDIWQDAPWDEDEQARRVYARQYYVTHLYLAKEWIQMWTVLDKGDYGKGKVRYDPSMRFYAQDLDLGRLSATWSWWTSEQAIALLPRLWRYTLLRSSLTSRADSYTVEVFEALLACKREKEALGLAELLTSISYKVKILVIIAEYIGKSSGREQESLQVLMRAYEIAKQMENAKEKVIALQEVGVAMVRGQHEGIAAEIWVEVEQSARTIEDIKVKSGILRELSQALLQERQWRRATLVVGSIDDIEEKQKVLRELRVVLMKEKQWKLIEETARSLANWREKAEALRELAQELIYEHEWEKAIKVSSSINAKDLRVETRRDLNHALIQAKELELAAKVAQSIDYPLGRAMALQEVGIALLHDQREAQAIAIWIEALKAFSSINMKMPWAEMLKESGEMLLQEQHEERAVSIARSIEDIKGRAMTLQMLGIVFLYTKRKTQAVAVWAEALELVRSVSVKIQRMELLLWFHKMSMQERQWKLAIEAANSIEDVKGQAMALRAVGIGLLHDQQEEQAVAVWTKALQTVRHFMNNREKVKILRDFEIVTKQKQDWKLEVVMCRSIRNPEERVLALVEIGMALAQDQQEAQAVAVWAEALQNARDIKDKQEKTYILREFGKILVQEQRWELAEEVAESLEVQDQKISALCELSKFLAFSQMFQQAEGVLADATTLPDTIASQKQRAIALCELSKALAQAQQWSTAEEVARSINIQEWQVIALCELSKALVERQHLEEAKAKWIEIKVTLQSEEESSERAKALGELSKVWTQKQQWHLALEVARYIDAKDQKVKALLKLGEAQAQERLHQQAIAMWREAEAVAETVESIVLRSNILCDLGISLARMQHQDWAKEVWVEVKLTARSIKEKDQKVTVLCILHSALEQGLRLKQASEVWAEVEETIRFIEGKEEKAIALCVLGKTLAQRNQWRQATEIWAESEEIIRSIEIKDQKARALYKLSCVLAREHQWERAHLTANSIEARDLRASALRELAEVLAKSGENDRLLHLVQSSWIRADIGDYSLKLLSQAKGLIRLNPEIGVGFYEAFAWVDAFLRG